MTQRSLEPTASITTTESAARERLRAAAEHERAAMLAEFNGTYDLAKEHREAAARLRRSASDNESS